MKASKEDFNSDEIRCITEIMDGKRAPIGHPAYSAFEAGYKGFCAKAGRSEAVWNKLIEGYRAQLKNAGLAMEQNTNKEYLDMINSNEHFGRAVEMIQQDGGLAVPPAQELALWSGGYALSVAIRNMGFCTLEGTPFGNILDNLKVTWEWKREGGLWNILSSAFVRGYESGRQAHIYFRTVDEMSVLYEQELPMLMKDKERVIVMHPVYQQGTQVCEVGYIKSEAKAVSLNLERDNNVFRYKAQALENHLGNNMRNAEFLPYKALEEKLREQGFAANQKVYLSYRSDKFIPGRAPFAREDEQTSGFDSRQEERQKFWTK